MYCVGRLIQTIENKSNKHETLVKKISDQSEIKKATQHNVWRACSARAEQSKGKHNYMGATQNNISFYSFCYETTICVM